MAIEIHDHSTTITGDDIGVLRLVTMLRGLRMEMAGMRLTSRGPSCYALAKREFGFKGNKSRVFDQLAEVVKSKLVAKTEAERDALWIDMGFGSGADQRAARGR